MCIIYQPLIYNVVLITFTNFRVLHTTVTADYETSNRKDCAITLRYDFPADIYVDKYELAAIAFNRKVGIVNIIFYNNKLIMLWLIRWNFMSITSS